jgi:hypothetical protein
MPGFKRSLDLKRVVCVTSLTRNYSRLQNFFCSNKFTLLPVDHFPHLIRYRLERARQTQFIHTRGPRVSMQWRGIVGIAVALTIASGREAISYFGVTKLVGAPPIRPPLPMARMIEDGVGVCLSGRKLSDLSTSRLSVCSPTARQLADLHVEHRSG